MPATSSFKYLWSKGSSTSLLDDAVQLGEMRGHGGGRIGRARDGHLHHVVVAMAVGVVALAVHALISRLVQLSELCSRCEAANE